MDLNNNEDIPMANDDLFEHGDDSGIDEPYVAVRLPEVVPVENESTENDAVVAVASRDDNMDFRDCPVQEVLGPEEVNQYMRYCVDDVNVVLGMPACTARVLMNRCKWEKDVLMERLYGNDQDRLFAEARVANPFETTTTIAVQAQAKCLICFDELPLTRLACGHGCCNQCWCSYLTTKITNGGVGLTITCPAPFCRILIDDATVTNFVRDPNVTSMYRRLVANTFVASHRLFRWCPAADCGNAIKVKHADAIQRVTCRCGRVFCFNCGDHWHDPIKCDMLKKWKKRYARNGEWMRWLSQNAKKCPGCHACIEKSGGCNHVTCLQCRHEFCWVCLRAWLPVHSYGCRDNVIVDVGGAAPPSEKYLYYSDRYRNHMESFESERNLHASIDKKIDDVLRQRRPGVSWIDAQFLKRGVEALCQCRRTLMYTYAFACCLHKNSSQSAIFEGILRDLERSSELLARYLAQDLALEDFGEIKRKILDAISYCNNRRQALLDHVHEGFANNSWKYNEGLVQF